MQPDELEDPIEEVTRRLPQLPGVKPAERFHVNRYENKAIVALPLWLITGEIDDIPLADFVVRARYQLKVTFDCEAALELSVPEMARIVSNLRATYPNENQTWQQSLRWAQWELEVVRLLHLSIEQQVQACDIELHRRKELQQLSEARFVISQQDILLRDMQISCQQDVQLARQNAIGSVLAALLVFLDEVSMPNVFATQLRLCLNRLFPTHPFDSLTDQVARVKHDHPKGLLSSVLH